MNSLRMCVVCREMKEKSMLIRVVKIKDNGTFIDDSLKAQGRGAYICKNQACIENAEKRRVLERAFRGGNYREIYEKMGEKING